MPILLTVDLAENETCGQCSLTANFIGSRQAPHYPKQNKVSLTSEEMGIEFNRKILAPVLLNNN